MSYLLDTTVLIDYVKGRPEGIEVLDRLFGETGLLYTCDIVACEALSRWNHPELGDISPGEYIPLAEEMGMIGKVSRSVLNRALSDCAAWPESVNISVNLSAIQKTRLQTNRNFLTNSVPKQKARAFRNLLF